MNFCLILFLCVSFQYINCGKFEAPVKLKNLICEYNETWVKAETCKIKSHSRVKRTAEITFTLLRPVHKAQVVFNIFKRYSDWKPWVIYNVRINGCEFVAGKSNPYLNLIKNIIKDHTSFIHKCPYLPGPLWIKNVDARDLSLSSLIVPNGEYRLDVLFYTESKTKPIATFKFFADVWEKN